MSDDRDTRLLSRLLVMLDTVQLEQPGEVAQVVQQVRRIGGQGLFRTLAAAAPAAAPTTATEVLLQDPRHRVATRLRSLGTFLRLIQAEDDPEITAALQRASIALQHQRPLAVSDLLTMLACLMDMLHLLRKQTHVGPAAHLREHLRGQADDHPGRFDGADPAWAGPPPGMSNASFDILLAMLSRGVVRPEEFSDFAEMMTGVHRPQRGG